jgi:branched-chain amino acid transport system permease protein
MSGLRGIFLFALGVGLLPLVLQSGVWISFILLTLYAALLGQAWNILGGFAGQFSFGHALFFGFGAYAQALAQMQWGINPWVAVWLAMGLAALVGVGVGALSFRYGLKGSYFALVTLAFAEVCRILAVSFEFTGAGVGLMLPLKVSLGNLQFADKRGYVYVLLALVVAALLVTWWLQHSRLGAYMQAVRDNDEAAQAVGVKPMPVKIWAIGLSGAFMGAAGAVYVQIYQYIDPSIAFGPHVSVEALVAAIVGGMGTLWGPIWGALVLHIVSDLTRNLFGAMPGLNMVIYGAVLVLIVMFAPRGIAGWGLHIKRAWKRRRP